MAIEDILHDALDREHDNQRALCAPNEVAELRAEQAAERRALTSALNEAGNTGRAALETAIEALGCSAYGREDTLRAAREKNAALSRERDEARAVAVRQQKRLVQAARAINSHTPHAPDGPVLPWETSARIEASPDPVRTGGEFDGAIAEDDPTRDGNEDRGPGVPNGSCCYCEVFPCTCEERLL